MNTMRSLRVRFGFLESLLYLTLVSAGFFVAGAISNHSFEFWYLIWNLFLAWVPVLVALWLLVLLKHHAWSSWRCLGLSLAWIAFLPNSFYMVSDFLHIQDYQRVDVVYDTVMFSSFILTGLLLGYTSLYIMHRELLRRIKPQTAWVFIGTIVLVCSFAIYLGRDLRWNTWDVLTNPTGILFDISELVIHPSTHYLAFTTTLTFFIFLISLYMVAWQLMRNLRVVRPLPKQ